jgi:hypothetical protein
VPWVGISSPEFVKIQGPHDIGRQAAHGSSISGGFPAFENWPHHCVRRSAFALNMKPQKNSMLLFARCGNAVLPNSPDAASYQ